MGESATKRVDASLPSFGSALCSSCPLFGLHDPVPTEFHDGAEVAVLAMAPGAQEVEHGRPLVGPSGKELQDALNLIGVRRSSLRLINAMSCQPPANDLRKAEHTVRRSQVTPKPLRHPVVACAPRVTDDLDGIDKVLVMGSVAARAVGNTGGIDAIRGSCEERAFGGRAIRFAYTVHPARVLREPLLRKVFQHDVAKAFRFFNDNLEWTDPDVLIADNALVLGAVIKRLRDERKPVAYDVETTIEVTGTYDSKLLCIGFGNEDFVVVVPWRTRSGQHALLGASDPRVRKVVAEFLQDPRVPLVGHNAGQFDRIVVERELGVTPSLGADTILLHLLADNERRHSLGFVGSYHTDYPHAWKSDHKNSKMADDGELWHYNAQDCAVTASLPKRLWPIIKARTQEHLISREKALQAVAVMMQKNGLRVHPGEVHRLRLAYAGKETKALIEARRLVPKVNPGSSHQLRRVLFDQWDLAPVKYSDITGDPSCDDETLRTMLTQYDISDEQATFIRAVRAHRKYTKLLSNYILPLWQGHQFCIISDDGRIHPSYHRLPSSGRYSSSGPNAQNIPYDVRACFIPAEGCVFVGIDADQLELRLIAEEAQAGRLLDTIESGADPHNETMEAIYGEGIWSLAGAPEDHREKGSGDFKRTRDVTKNTRYLWQYGGGYKRAWEQVTSVEDGEGRLLYTDLSREDVREVCEGLSAADPEIPEWWKKVRFHWSRHGFVADSIWIRRRDFEGEAKLQEMVNHPIQAGGFHIVAEAMLEILYGTQPWFTTECVEPVELRARDFGARLVTQTHDSMLFEVPKEAAGDFKEILNRVMTRRRRDHTSEASRLTRAVRGLPVPPRRITYTGEAKVGPTWKDV